MSSTLTEFIGLFANVATAVGLFITAWQVRQGSKTSQGQFMLQLDQQLSTFDGIYLRLRRCHEKNAEFELLSEEELLAVREYMGFLEIIEILIEGGSISERDFKAIFGHRIIALNNNLQVRTEIISPAPHKWTKFESLVRRVVESDVLRPATA